MPYRVHRKALNLALAYALVCGWSGSVPAQQSQSNNSAVLPGPSLDDTPAPPSSAPAPAAPQPAAAAPAPAPSSATNASPAPSAAPAPVTRAAPEPAAPPPVTQAPPPPVAAPAPRREPAPVTEQSSADEAWYERMWDSVTGWVSGIGSKLSSPRTAAEPAAAAPAPAPAPKAAAGPVKGREGFAADTPERVIHSGMGDCVKTGTWTPEHGGAQCPGATAGETRTAAAEPAAAAPKAPPQPAPKPRAEPVEVKPLPDSATKDAKPLEAEAMPPAAVQPAPPPRAAAAAPARKTMTLSADALFALGKADLKPSSRKGLDDLAAQLAQADYDVVKVTGHTDPTGAAAGNDRLSKRRAEAVKRYLVSKGVPADKIKAEGVGSRMPVVEQKDCAGLPKAKKAACYQPDRRVEIEVSGASTRTAAK